MTRLADRLLDLVVPRARAAAAGSICLRCGSGTYSKYCYDVGIGGLYCRACGTC